MLEHLLLALNRLWTEGLFTFSVVIVDNDPHGSARHTIERVRTSTTLRMCYDVEPERSISLARNRSVRNADGTLIAFIDDDEFPAEDWLVRLFQTLTESRADGVLGPVEPYFDDGAPEWLVRSGLCERPRLPSGAQIHDSLYTRTGNVLIRKAVFTDTGIWFDPAFGIIGGGDAIFFKRTMAVGKVFVWCDDAIVFEAVPKDRQSRRYYLRRAWSRGVGAALESRFLSIGTAKSFAAVTLYTAALPVLFTLGHHLFMKYLVKDCDHLSKLLAHAGITLIPEKPQ